MSEEKTESNSVFSMVKLGLVLAAFAVVSCALLAVVNNVTSPVIAQNQVKKANEKMKAVFADADSFEEVNDFAPSTDSSISIQKMYLAKKGGSVVGAVVQVAGPTYDKATIILGIDLTQTVTGVQFLELSDSPGFGLKANDPTYKVKSGSTFYGQFAGKKASEGFKAGETFDAVSGATITSKGVAGLLTQGTYSAGLYLSEKYGGESSTAAAPVADEQKLFTFEDAISDINSSSEATSTESVSIEDITSAEQKIIHNMIVNKEALVKDSNGNVIEAAVSVSGQTYSENGGTVIAVVNKDRTIVGSRIIFLKDSPSQGQNTTRSSFYSQFAGKSADQDFRNGTDFDAVSGATISSDCIADMVKVASYEAAAIMENYGGVSAPGGSADYSLNENYLEE